MCDGIIKIFIALFLLGTDLVAEPIRLVDIGTPKVDFNSQVLGCFQSKRAVEPVNSTARSQNDQRSLIIRVVEIKRLISKKPLVRIPGDQIRDGAVDII